MPHFTFKLIIFISEESFFWGAHKYNSFNLNTIPLPKKTFSIGPVAGGEIHAFASIMCFSPLLSIVLCSQFMIGDDSNKTFCPGLFLQVMDYRPCHVSRATC